MIRSMTSCSLIRPSASGASSWRCLPNLLRISVLRRLDHLVQVPIHQGVRDRERVGVDHGLHHLSAQATLGLFLVVAGEIGADGFLESGHVLEVPCHGGEGVVELRQHLLLDRCPAGCEAAGFLVAPLRLRPPSRTPSANEPVCPGASCLIAFSTSSSASSGTEDELIWPGLSCRLGTRIWKRLDGDGNTVAVHRTTLHGGPLRVLGPDPVENLASPLHP